MCRTSGHRTPQAPPEAVIGLHDWCRIVLATCVNVTRLPSLLLPAHLFIHWLGASLMGESSHTGIAQNRRPLASVETDFLQAARACNGSLSAISVAHAAAASGPAAIAAEMVCPEISPCAPVNLSPSR